MTKKIAPKKDDAIPDGLSQNPIKHPKAKEPLIAMAIIVNQPPASAFGDISLVAVPTVKPMTTPQARLNKGALLVAFQTGSFWDGLDHRFRQTPSAMTNSTVHQRGHATILVPIGRGRNCQNCQTLSRIVFISLRLNTAWHL